MPWRRSNRRGKAMEKYGAVICHECCFGCVQAVHGQCMRFSMFFMFFLLSQQNLLKQNIEKLHSHAVQSICLPSVFHGLSFFSHFFVVKLVSPFRSQPPPLGSMLEGFGAWLMWPSQKLVSVGSNAVSMLHRGCRLHAEVALLPKGFIHNHS